MSRTYPWFFAVLGMIVLAGCGELTNTPHRTLAKAYQAIQQKDLAAFVTTLKGEALEAYGNEKGLQELGDQLAGLDIVPAEPVLLSTQDLNCGVGCLKIESIYSVDVLAKKAEEAGNPQKVLMNATVNCLKWRNLPEPKMSARTTCKIQNLQF